MPIGVGIQTLSRLKTSLKGLMVLGGFGILACLYYPIFLLLLSLWIIAGFGTVITGFAFIFLGGFHYAAQSIVYGFVFWGFFRLYGWLNKRRPTEGSELLL